jgi:hypothetical protein
MNYAMIINVYIDVNEECSNPFDHPTSLERFGEENTLRATVESINRLEIDNDDRLKLYIIGTATQESLDFDRRIRSEIEKCFVGCPFELFILTNSDIYELHKESGSEFISVKGYPELRNLGFIISSIMNEDIIIQIDDDELLRPLYLNKLKKILKENPDKYVFTAPYEKNGTVRILTEDPLKLWRKFSPMDRDMVRFYEENSEIRESLFGFGGNMIIRREFAEHIFYPPEIPRGEDFSMLLASRLIYENGNSQIGLVKGNPLFRSFFLPFEEMTIIHKPPFEAKKDFLKYFENNMKRFIMEWGIFSKQKGLTVERMEQLSYYIREMIGHTDMRQYLEPIFNEMSGMFPDRDINMMRERLLESVEYYENFNRWEDYMMKQKLYIEMIKELKADKYRKMIVDKRITR